jgi:hypothetical protein
MRRERLCERSLGVPRGGRLREICAQTTNSAPMKVAGWRRAARGVATRRSPLRLLVPGPVVKRIRVHDLRGTFVTLALANGRLES